MSVQLVIADPHLIVREGLRALLELTGEFRVIGEANNGREAIALCDSLQPDVVITEIALPELSGTALVRELRRCKPSVRVIVLTMYKNQELVGEVLHAGAAGYLPKSCSSSELTLAIRSAVQGAIYAPASVATEVLNLLASEPTERGTLTCREMEVLRLIVRGLSNQALAHRLNLSIHTVRVHRSSIMRKLGVHSATELMGKAFEQGFF